MTDTKHTSGPWVFVEEDGDLHIKSADGESLMCDMDYYPWTPTNKKDWSLIAAAPELLEACIGLLQVQDGLPMTGLEATRKSANARSAIAKAKGQTS